MSKLSEIIKLGIAPGFNTKTTDPTLPENAVPRAFKKLEQTQSASSIARESGFSVKKIKQVWNMLALLTAMLATVAHGADLTRGVTITTSRLTTSQLHSLIDSSSISTGFYTDSGKDLLGAVDSTDYFLLYDVSAGLYKKMTLGTLLMNNTDLITTQADDVNPAYNDYVLTYNASATALAKVSITNLLFNTNLIASLPNITNLTQSATVKVLHGGTNAQIEVTNLWANFKYRAAFTNLAEHTAPTNTDKLLIFDSVAGTNKYTGLSGLITNLPTVTTNGPNDWFLVVTNGNVSKISGNSLSNALFLALGTVTKYEGSNALPALAASQTFTHGLAGTPQSVRVVAYFLSDDAANSGYTTGDELDIGNIYGGTGYPFCTVKTTSTNILVRRDWTGANVVKNGNGYDVTSKISIKVYALYRP